MIQRSTRSFQRNRKPAPRPPRSFSPVCSLKEPMTLHASAAEAASATALNAKAYEPPTLATSTPPAIGPSMKPTLLRRWRVAFAQASSSAGTRFGMAAVEAERYGDCATAAQRGEPDQRDGRVHEHEREVDHGAGGVGADHDDAAVEAVAEHARERSREPVGADHGEQSGGAPDGRMGPAEDERHERHEGDLATGHGEHAADGEAVDCGLVGGRAVHFSDLADRGERRRRQVPVPQPRESAVGGASTPRGQRPDAPLRRPSGPG